MSFLETETKTAHTVSAGRAGFGKPFLCGRNIFYVYAPVVPAKLFVRPPIEGMRPGKQVQDQLCRDALLSGRAGHVWASAPSGALMFHQLHLPP